MNLRWKIAQAFEIRWWQNYLKHKPKAGYLDWKREYWLEFLERTGVQLKKGSRVLDIGCGPAGIFMVLNNQQVEALDPLLSSYDKKLPHFNISDYENVRFHATAFEDYQIERPFDTVFCLNAINHVADLDACMDKLVETTKPGGTIVLSIDAHNYELLKHLFRMLPGDVLHPHQYDLNEYSDMLTKRNCTIEKKVLYKREMIFNYYVLVARKEL